MSRRRVVVTGTGLVTSLNGNLDDVWTVDEVWARVCNGDSGIRSIERFDCSKLPVRFAGEITTFDARQQMKFESKAIRRMDRFVQLVMVAADQAAQQSGLLDALIDPFRCGVTIGSALGGVHEIEEQHSRLFNRGPGRVSAFLIPRMIVNAAAGNVAVHWGLHGPCAGLASSAASSLQAIGNSVRLIQSGFVDAMIVGGSESPLNRTGINCFARSGILSTCNATPHRASRPFDSQRDGIVLSEGAGILVLECRDHAQARGAEILAEVLGYGQSSDGFGLKSPEAFARGPRLAMQAALQNAKLSPNTIDFLHANGDGAVDHDRSESLAIREVFRSRADGLPVSSTKGHIGHHLGAAGAVASVLSIAAIQRKVIPPTKNLDEPGEGCDLEFVTQDACETSVNYVMNNCIGLGGQNATLILGAA